MYEHSGMAMIGHVPCWMIQSIKNGVVSTIISELHRFGELFHRSVEAMSIKEVASKRIGFNQQNGYAAMLINKQFVLEKANWTSWEP